MRQISQSLYGLQGLIHPGVFSVAVLLLQLSDAVFSGRQVQDVFGNNGDNLGSDSSSGCNELMVVRFSFSRNLDIYVRFLYTGQARDLSCLHSFNLGNALPLNIIFSNLFSTKASGTTSSSSLPLVCILSSFHHQVDHQHR